MSRDTPTIVRHETPSLAPPAEVGAARPLRRIEMSALLTPEDETEWTEADGAPPTRAGFLRRNALFLSLFVVPVVAATVLFGWIASDVYVSEAKFIVRAAAHGGDGGGLAILMQTQGMSRAVDETHAVGEYILSRDAAQLLAHDDGLREVMARPEADVFSRYPGPFGKVNDEQFYRAYRRMVDVSVDTSTGISLLEVRASRPDDATRLAAALIAKGEAFVNRLNARANGDAIGFGEALVAESRARMTDVEKRLADYRNREMVVDPGRESADTLAALGTLVTEISRQEASLAQQLAMAPDSPGIAPQREKIKSYREELAKRQRSVVGGPGSIAGKLQGYEMLMLERELAARSLGTAMIELEKARQESQSQRIYLQTIVVPSKPDQPTLPRRLTDILLVAGLAFAVWWIARTFVASTLEHR